MVGHRLSSMALFTILNLSKEIHPGGKAIISAHIGKDPTAGFNGAVCDHNPKFTRILRFLLD